MNDTVKFAGNLSKEIPVLFIFIKDLSGWILDVNDTAARTLECEVSDIRGKHSSKFFPDKLWKKYLKDDLRVAEKGEATMGIVEPYNVKGQDNKLWVRTDKLPLRDEFGKIYGVIVYCQDITSFIRSEEQFFHELNSKRLELARVTHELCTPLSGLPVLIQSLQQIDTKEMTSSNVMCVNSALSNAKITFELLKRVIEKHNPTESIEHNFNFYDVVTDVVAMWSDIASEKSTTLCMQIKKKENKTFKGDVRRIRSIFNKLMEFSVHLSLDGEVIVKASCEANLLSFEVTSTHPIKFNPNNSICHIQESRDQWLEKQTSFQSLKDLVKNIGGSLEATKSEQGQGLKFLFTVSLKPSTEHVETKNL